MSSVTTAYTQVIWRAIKRRDTKLATIDTIFAVVSSVWELLRLSVWWKYHLLLVLACIIWLLPIASVITPASLIVAVAATKPTPWTMIQVPNVDFLSLNFANTFIPPGLSITFKYSNPKYAVDKVVAATASQGVILPIPAPAGATNSSWALDFIGPSLNCTTMQGPMFEAIKENIESAVGIDGCGTSFGYISWTPSLTEAPDSSSVEGFNPLPFFLNRTSYTLPDGSNGSYTLQSGYLGPQDSLPATIYVATFPNMTEIVDRVFCENDPVLDLNVVQCELYNTSYHASFSFTNGVQMINVTQGKTPYNPVVPVYWLNSTAAGPLPVYSANGTLIPGVYNTAEVQTISYQAVMESFGRLLVGTISNSWWSYGAIINSNTSVMSTVLADTLELGFLNDYPEENINQIGSGSSLQQYIALNNNSWNGVDVVDDDDSKIPIREALEILFQNITIGLFSSKLLQPNTSSPYAPPLTNVTLPQYQTVYIYEPAKLWVAYGVAIFFATMSVLVGIVAIFVNGVTYTNEFSTIFRAARHAHIEATILPEHLNGNDPLPKYLEKAMVSFPDDRPSRTMNSAEHKIGSKEISVTSTLLGHEDEGRIRPYDQDQIQLEPLSIGSDVSSISSALFSSEPVPSAYQTSARGVQNASVAFSIAQKPLATRKLV